MRQLCSRLRGGQAATSESPKPPTDCQFRVCDSVQERRRTIAGVFHHISPQHADLYFHEIGFRWSQRFWKCRSDAAGAATSDCLSDRNGASDARSPDGGIIVKSTVAVFG
jgi:hypothetical protein